MLWSEPFLEYLKCEKNYSVETVKAYESDLLQFDDYLKEFGLNPDTDEDMGAAPIRGWIVQLMDHGYKPTSINRKVSTLRSYYKFLIRKGKAEKNPTIGIRGPKKKKPLPVFLKESEMDRLLDEEDFGEGFIGIRDRMIVDIFYSTGIRLAELIGLNDVDVDLTAMTIKVRGKRNKERIIPFGENLRDSLRNYIRERNSLGLPMMEALFIKENGYRLKRGDVEIIVKRSLSKVVTQKKRSPHVLRHTFATTMLNHDADLSVIKEILGHESLATTEIYTHTTFEELKKVYKQAHPRS